VPWFFEVVYKIRRMKTGRRVVQGRVRLAMTTIQVQDFEA
jgi:hypothetical protein